MEKNLNKSLREIAQKVPSYLVVGNLLLAGLTSCNELHSSFSECTFLTGNEPECLEIYDPNSAEGLREGTLAAIDAQISATKQAEKENLQQTRWAVESQATATALDAKPYAINYVQSGDTILGVLERMGFNFGLVNRGSMATSQPIGIIRNGELIKIFTLEDLLNSDPNDKNYWLLPEDCVISSTDLAGINTAFLENKGMCNLK